MIGEGSCNLYSMIKWMGGKSKLKDHVGTADTVLNGLYRS